MISGRQGVWVNGHRSGEHHLIDLAGPIAKTVHCPQDHRTGGVGRRCGRRFVAVYVAPDQSGLVLQVDGTTFPLDGATYVKHDVLCGGLMTRLRIDRDGLRSETVRQSNIAGALLRRVDPAHDGLDASLDDFLADVADIANSGTRRAWMMQVKDPDAGPWSQCP